MAKEKKTKKYHSRLPVAAAAVALALAGPKAGLLDADLHGPSVPRMTAAAVGFSVSMYWSVRLPGFCL